MAAISGKCGTLHITGVAVIPVRNWVWNGDANLKEYGDNETGGWTDQVSGTMKANGTYQVRVDNVEALAHGIGNARIQAQFHLDGTGANYIEGYIKLGAISITADINDGAEENWDCTWANSGAHVGYGIAALLLGQSCSSSSGA